MTKQLRNDKMVIAGKRRKGGAQEVFSLTGIVLRPEAAKQEENRIYTLLLKGVLVYLFVMGGIGSFLSAFDIEYSRFIVNFVVFLIAVFCSVLYYNKYTMNIGHLSVLMLMISGGGVFSRFINSGFYAVLNEVTKAASDFFDTNAMRNYGEQIGNRQLAVTISTCFIVCVCSVLLSIMISRKMRHLSAVLLSALFLLIPIYLEREPDGIYTAMFFSGLISVNLLCRNQVSLTQNNAVYLYLPQKKRVSCVLCARAIAVIMASVFVLCLLVTQLMPVFYAKERFQRRHTMSALKAETMDTVENLSVLGLMGLFNFYPNTGGMTGGTLGGVSSVRLDFETDLRLEFAPYCNERLYFKTFTGGTYFPCQNQWSRLADENGLPVLEQNDTFSGLLKRYEEKEAESARGVIKITNVAAPAGAYLPYYAEDTNRLLYPGQTMEYVYYPLLSGDVLEDSEEPMRDGWLYVPEQNLEAVAAFCQEAGLLAENMDAFEIADRLAAYYQETIPYTLRPGMTPYRKDFVNYFLSENRRGYCAHFASAATLIFRYLGIPARYAEGYAVDAVDISENGTLLEEARYEEYYDGRSLLGTEAVVSVEVTDANAHAWVEIYDAGIGWVAVEVTPAADEEEGGESLWQRLLHFLTGNQGEDEETVSEEAEQEAEGLAGQPGQKMGTALRIAAVLILLGAAGGWSFGKWSKRRRYLRADRNEKLVVRYQTYIRRIARKQHGLTDRVNYEEQLCWLAENGFWEADEEELRSCIEILEKAGFSRTEISEREFLRVAGHITNRR